MKNQNKILMSLLTASISALAAAPYLIDGKEDKSEEKKDGKLVGISIGSSETLSQEDKAMKQEIKGQIEAMLTKKSPMVKIGESVDIVTENYGKSETIRSQVFKELELGVGYDASSIQDATSQNWGANAAAGNTGVSSPNGVANMCHSACHGVCHGVCHGACHGARGWR